MCVCACVFVYVFVSVVLIYSCTFLKRIPSALEPSGTAVAVKQFISLMHFVAAKGNGKSSSYQVEAKLLVDLLDRPKDPTTQTTNEWAPPTRHKMAQRKRFSMKFMTHGNIRRSLTFTSPRCFLPLKWAAMAVAGLRLGVC